MAGITLSGAQKKQSDDLWTIYINAFKSGGGNNWFSQLKSIEDTTSTTVVLQSTPVVDSLLSTDPTQTYRIAFKSQFLKSKEGVTTRPSVTMYFGSSDQITVVGETISISPQCPTYPLWNSSTEPGTSREYSYRMTFTDRGFAFSQWIVTNVNSTSSNGLLVVQRPVNPTTGAPKQDGESPIFALRRSPGSGTNVFDACLIREKSDSSTGSWFDLGTASASNLYRCTLDWSHPNLFDNYSHIVKFPFGLASPNALYLEEFDLMCIVNGTAFASNQEVKIAMYGQPERKYTTTWGDVEYGRTGSGNQPTIAKIIGGGRVGILTAGGGLA